MLWDASQHRKNAGLSGPLTPGVGCLVPETQGGGNYPTKWWAGLVLGLAAGVECSQHRAPDRRSTVATAKFARLEACGKGAIDRVFDGTPLRHGHDVPRANPASARWRESS